MKGTGKQFLPRTAFTRDEHAQGRVGDAASSSANRSKSFTGEDDILQSMPLRRFRFPVARFVPCGFEETCVGNCNRGKVGKCLKELDIEFGKDFRRFPAVKVNGSDR